jgi:signal transduction histidine kinase
VGKGPILRRRVSFSYPTLLSVMLKSPSPRVHAPLLRLLWLGSALSAMALGAPPALAGQGVQGGEVRTVLFIDDFDLNRPVWQTTFSALRGVVEERGLNAVFYTETLDVQRIPDFGMQMEARNWIVQKYRRRPPDLLIGHGPQSLETLLALRAAVGLDIPILHLRADPTRPRTVDGMPRVPSGSGMLLGQVEDALARDILQLLPETQTLLIVGDSEAEIAVQLERFRGSLPASVELVAMARPTIEMVERTVLQSKPGVVIYYTLVVEDESGRPWGPRGYLLELASRQLAPIFGAFTTQMGTGILGGTQVDPVQMGEAVGMRAADLLEGIPPSELPSSMFDSWALTLDWQVARRWSVLGRVDPEEVAWVGRPMRFWEAFPRTTASLSALFLMLFGTGAALALSRRTLRQARDARSQLSRRLMAVLDGDRGRVARDLHDDLCQEMTLVALQLDRIQPTAGDRVRVLIDRTRDIAHNLHAAPSGGVPLPDSILALATNLREATQSPTGSSLEISVRSDRWPHRLPPEAASNLYRAVQESLQNVLRHSGATECRVELEGMEGACRISVWDNGAGFLPRESEEKGLGLLSIRERMAGLGGTVHLTTAPGKGTQLVLQIPLSESFPSESTSR